MQLKPCLCPKREAKTVKLITSKIWQCPRCGGVGSIIEPVVSVPSVEQIENVILLESNLDVYGINKLAKSIHAMLTSGKDKQ